MITVNKVTGLALAYKNVTSYVICEDKVPLLAPSAFLLHVSTYESASTAETYSSRLKSFFSAIQGLETQVELAWKNISDKAMSGYIYGVLKQQRGLKDKSIENHVAALKSFYKFAYEFGYINRPPVYSFSYKDNIGAEAEMEKVSKELHDQYFTEEEFCEVILSNVQGRTDFLLKRNELMMKLGYYAGFRSFEVTHKNNLRRDYLKKMLPKDWKPKAMKLRVFGKGSKFRSVPFPIKLLEDLHTYLWKFDDVFGEGNIICKSNGETFQSKNPATEIFSDSRNTFLSLGNCSELEFKQWVLRTFHKSRKCFATNFVTHCYEHQIDPYIELPQSMGHTDKLTTFGYIYFEALQNHRHAIVKQLALEHTELHKNRFGIKEKVNG